MTTDPPAWVRAEMDAAEEVALAATKGPWRATHREDGTHHVFAASDRKVHRDGGYPADWPPEVVNPAADADHIARHDPAAVLRRIAADRALLDDLLAERHYVNDGDCWYTCRAATEERDGGENCNDEERGKPCDCGRDTRIHRYVRHLAEGWGWTEETA